LHYAAWNVIMTSARKIAGRDFNRGFHVMSIGLEYRTAARRQLAVYLGVSPESPYGTERAAA
jgi:uncharacterized protein involved in copper resistance